MNKEIFLSIIIPTFNEERRLGVTLEDILGYLKNKSFTSEIIIVDDGSLDKTVEFAKKFKDRFSNFEIIANEKNKGKGYVVKIGMLKARGFIRLFMDADNSVTIHNLDNFIDHLKKGADIVIGSIEVPGSYKHDDNQWYRRFVAKIGKWTSRFLVTPGIYDTNRGFKLFTKNATESIFPKQTINRWAFDTELMAIALRQRFKISEIPVKWINPETNSINFGSYVRSFWELLKIKKNLIYKKYD